MKICKIKEGLKKSSKRDQENSGKLEGTKKEKRKD